MRLSLRPVDRRPDPAPLVTNDRATILTGIGVWAVLGVGALLFHARLTGDGHGWVLWTPPAGIALGLMGLAYVIRLERRRQG